MGILHQIFFAYPYVAVAAVGLMVWALIDLSTRQVPAFWVWVILLLPGVGALAYLLAFVRPNLHSLGGSWLTSRPSLEELRFRAEQAPTLTNHLALAERLIEGGDHEAALSQLEAARKCEAEHCQVLYWLAYCHLEEDRPVEAVRLLERLTQREPRWSQDMGWHLLVAAHEEAGDRAAAMTACRELLKLSSTLAHCCLLARLLIKEGQTDEAEELLLGALQEYDYAPGWSRRRNRRPARVARQLLRQATATGRR